MSLSGFQQVAFSPVGTRAGAEAYGVPVDVCVA